MKLEERRKMIELEVPYTQTEMLQQFGIAASTFKRRRKDYLTSFELAYKFSIEQRGNHVIYTFHYKYHDWEKPPRNNQTEAYKEQIKIFIRSVIADTPSLQTAANLNRIAWSSKESNEVTSLGLAQSTTEQYIRICLKEMLGSQPATHGKEGAFLRKAWARLDRQNNRYIELSQQLIDELIKLVHSKYDYQTVKDNLDAYESMVSGEITQKEASEKISENMISQYILARKEFKEKYGYLPLKVPEYLLGITFTDEETNKIEQKLEAREAAYGLELESGDN